MKSTLDARLTNRFYGTNIIFLSLPFGIFSLTWLTPIFGIPLFLFMVLLLISWFRRTHFPEISFSQNRHRLFLAFGILFFWVFASGIGGYTFQNHDHFYRNAVLRDLLSHDWPVFHDGTAFVYYFGYFLLPAFGGKCLTALGADFSWGLEFAFFLMFLQTLWALFSVYILTAQYLKRFALWPLIFLIGFSGLDMIPYLFFHHPLSEGPIPISTGAKLYACLGPENAPHLEWFTMPWLNSSITGLVYWVFNQSVPFMLGMCLFLQLPNHRASLFLYAVLFLSAPFPCVGLFPLMTYWMLREGGFRVSHVLKRACTPLNLLSLPTIGIIACFFKSNTHSGMAHWAFPESLYSWGVFLMFFATEFGVWMLLIGNIAPKRKKELLILLITTAVCSFIQLGGGADFAMRTAIPCFFFLMLCLLETWYAPETGTWRRNAIVLIFLLGAMTPIMEWKRCAGNTLMTCLHSICQSTPDENGKHYYIRDNRLKSVFELRALNDPCWKNFTGKVDSPFFQYLGRKKETDTEAEAETDPPKR